MKLTAAEANALLEWYVAMGVDCAVDEVSIDRFVLSSAPPGPPAPSPVPPAVEWVRNPPSAGDHAAANGDDRAIAEAELLARNAGTLEELQAILERYEGCALKKTASRLVFSDGVPGSSVMLVGEAPGRDEDLQGKPFVGRSGQLLDRILAAIGRDRSSVYIANVVPWRPPANRTPTPEELRVCLPFIRRQIELAAPRVIILLGGAALSSLTGTSVGIVKSRGQWQNLTFGALQIPAMPTFHPAYLLRNPLSKRFVWRDFLEVSALLQSL